MAGQVVTPNTFKIAAGNAPVVRSKAEGGKDTTSQVAQESGPSHIELSAATEQNTTTAEPQADFDHLDFTYHQIGECQDTERRQLEHKLDKLLGAAFDLGLKADELTIDWTDELHEDTLNRDTLLLGRAVDNHRRYSDGQPKEQEDRHCALSFPALSAPDAATFLADRIAKIDSKTRLNESGSTLTGVIVTETGDVVTAHLGDSPVSAVIISGEGKLKSVLQLTQDHKVPPGTRSERAADGTYFEDHGGRRRIGNNNSINMTHALGNRRFGAALSHRPEIKTHLLQERLVTGDRLLLLITTDGAHNDSTPITHAAHAKTIESGLEQGLSLNLIARKIAKDSAGLQDNVTVLLFEVQSGKGACIAVFDGHAGSQTSQQACCLFQDYAKDFVAASTDTITLD